MQIGEAIRMKCIYKDEAGNKLFADKKKNVTTYSAKNIKGKLISIHGLNTMLKEKGLKPF